MGITFIYKPLHGDLIYEAKRLTEMVPPRGSEPKVESQALGAIILSATAVEAAVNSIVEQLFRPAEVARVKAPVLWLARQHVAKTKPIDKRLDLLALARGDKISWSDEPWVSIPGLFHLRNALVHYNAEPVSTSKQGRVFRNEELKKLAKRLELWPIFADAGGTWLDVFLNSDGAKWAFTTAKATLAALDNPPWTSRAT